MTDIDNSVEVTDSSTGETIRIPSYEWLYNNFKSRSGAIRFLAREYKLPVKFISGYLHVPYRQVYGVIARMNKEPEHVHEKVCPVCRRKL